MLITKRTRVKDVLPLLNENNMEKFLDIIPPQPLNTPILSLTIGDFADIILDEESYIKTLLQPRNRAYLAFGQLKQFRIEMKNLTDYLNKMQVKQTPDEIQASRGIEQVDFIGRMLIDVTKFFNLHSFTEAENIKLSDYILILKDNVANAQYQRNFSKILEQKSKTKKK